MLSDNIKKYQEAIEEAKKHPNEIPFLRVARIRGWNLALEIGHEQVAKYWNDHLPKSVWIDHDAFEDKGETPEYLTDEEMKHIVLARGGTVTFGEKGFDPMWQWKFPKPNLSHVEEQRRKKAWLKRMPKNNENQYGYGNNKYHGD